MLTNLPNPSCCRTSNPNHLCPKCKAAYNRSADDSLRNNILPIPTINWAAEQAERLANRPSYHGKASLPRGTKTEEPQEAQFVERNFSDLLAAEPAVQPAPPLREPTLVTNLPDVKDDVMPTAEALWQEAIAEDRQRLNLP